MTSERTDEDLMVAYVAGDAGAFSELFRRYAPVLLRLLRRHLSRPSDAQDLAQQTFLQLHRARHDFRAGSRLRPWIYTIALNLARDTSRWRSRHPEISMDEETLPVSAAVQPDVADNAVPDRRLREALGCLPEEQRQAIELHWFAQLSFSEIAVIVGTSPGAARVRAHRGYTTLRRTLDPGIRELQ
jgi:RNA polymerase sigma-70 factor, ECF subfamily